ncbi:MAG: DUF2807 domain-containing protein [Parvularculaceae bacterium]|nr:DUF2807 domain-containing protein [Parvularculaceae bacterium]
MRLFFGFLIGLALAVAVAATAFKVAWGDIGEFEDRDRSADEKRVVEAVDFTEIEIKGVFELEVRVGDDYSVTLSGRREDLDRTRAHVESGRLVLDTEQKGEGRRISAVKRGVTAVVMLPALDAIEIEGVVDADISGVNADKFSADLSGVGEVDLSGVCVSFQAEISGIGEVDAKNLECQDVRVEVSGIGDTRIYASRSADADLTGIGRIEIYGSPANVSKTQTGPFGRIKVK